MPAPWTTASSILNRLLAGGTAEERRRQLAPRPPEIEPLPPRIPAGNDHTAGGLDKRRAMLAERGIRTDQLAGRGPEIAPEAMAGNIENHVGFARVPVGVIGPLRINGAHARGDFYVPMATTEGALVASYNRGAYVLSQSGGVAAICLTEAVCRSPCFIFESMSEAGAFLAWTLPQFETLAALASATSRHCRLEDIRTSLIGKDLYLGFDYETGDAAGQNMVTLATEAVCRHLVEHAPVKPVRWYVEGNLSGDKKATMLSYLFARGKKAVAEAVIRRDVLERFIHATPADLFAAWHTSVLGGMQSGSIGSQAHYANALAALFIACGQDAACGWEAPVGLTRLVVTNGGEL